VKTEEKLLGYELENSFKIRYKYRVEFVSKIDSALVIELGYMI
jgi:hypothetical protein